LTGAIDKYSKLIPVFSLLIVQFAPVSANAVGFGKSCGVKVPTVCPHVVRPVCGCDNKTYSNDCERVVAQAQKAHQGKCTGNPKY
jgi:hypothetical protein